MCRKMQGINGLMHNKKKRKKMNLLPDQIQIDACIFYINVNISSNNAHIMKEVIHR